MIARHAGEMLLAIAVVAPTALALAWSAAEARALRDGLPVLARRGAPLARAPLAAPAADVPEAPARHEPDPDGVFRVDLEDLAFDDYDPPELRIGASEPLGRDAFPPAVAALHGESVELRGYPIVVTLDGLVVERFVLARFPPGCCFGTLPVPDEWVDVVSAEGADWGDLVPISPVTVRGVLAVREEIDADGYVQSLYRLADAVPVARR